MTLCTLFATSVFANTDTPIRLVIHGGAGTITKDTITPEQEKEYKEKLTEALNAGYAVLNSGGTSIEAVQKSINVMEDSPLFNAGKGAVLPTMVVMNLMPLLWMVKPVKLALLLVLLQLKSNQRRYCCDGKKSARYDGIKWC